MKYWCPHHQKPGLFHQWRRGAPPVLKRTLRNRRDLIIRQNPQNFRALGPKWAKRNGHTKMALCAKFSRYAALNAHICRGKSPEGSDRARCYAFNSFPLPYECRFNTPLSLHSTGRSASLSGWLQTAECTRIRCSAQKTEYTTGIRRPSRSKVAHIRRFSSKTLCCSTHT